MKRHEHMSSRGLLEDFFRDCTEEGFVCEFKPEWGSWFGHFDRAAKGPDAPKLGPGCAVVSKEPAANGDEAFHRRVAMIGTCTLGDNLVLFDRYSNPDDHGPVMYNAGEETKKWFGLPDYCGVFTKEMWLNLISKFG